MTDYLEELLDNTGALLEQVRRLERSGPGPALEEAEGEVPSSAFRSAQGSMEERDPAGKLKTWETLRTVELRKKGKQDAPDAGTGGGGVEDGTLEPPERIPTPLEKEKEGAVLPEKGTVLPKKGAVLLEGDPVLLEQLERLERAAASELGESAANRSAARAEAGGWRRTVFSAGPAGARGETVYSSVTGTAGGNWTLGAGFVRMDAQPAEELRWAEQADRAFRRDSRRYDGDFYLY